MTNPLKEWLDEQWKADSGFTVAESLDKRLRRLAEPDAALVETVARVLRDKCGLSTDSYTGARAVLTAAATELAKERT